MTSWIKDTVLDALGFSSPPAPAVSIKRKASDDHRGRAKRVRYDAEAYPNAPYGSDESACFADENYLATCSKTKTKFVQMPTVEVYAADLAELSTEEWDGRLMPGHMGQRSLTFTPKYTAAPNFGDFASKSVKSPVATATSSKHSTATPKAKPVTTTTAPKPIATTSKPNLIATPTIPKFTRVALSPGAQDLKWKVNMSPSEKRTSDPNKRALELALSAKSPKRAILHDFQEPEYACRDVEIRDGIWSIMDLVEGFSEEFFAFEVQVESSGRLSESFFKEFSVDSAKVIGCVASGGPAGVQGWHDLFVDKQKRRAVAMAVVGNVLVEQVFGHLFFGGTEEQIKHMTELQDEFKDEDGFDRNAHYAAYTRSVLKADKTGACNLPANLANHVNLIVGAIYTHLKPILSLSPHRATVEAIIPPLHTIVTQAGLLSLSMRLDPHTVYHFTPTFKEDTFTSTRMECFNKAQMEQQHPRTPASEPRLTRTEKERRATLSEAEKKRATNDDPLTQITIIDGVTAYRLGGWENPASTTTSRRYEKPEWARRGVRMRALTQGWVYCRWGRARSLKDGKGNDGPAAHGVAWDGGFKEFRDVEGVVDWLGLEREGKKEAFEEAEKAMKKGKAVTEADLQTQLREEVDG